MKKKREIAQLSLFPGIDTRANSPPKIWRFIICCNGRKYSCIAKAFGCTDVFVHGFCVERRAWQFGFFLSTYSKSGISELLEIKEISRARLLRLLEKESGRNE